MVDQSTLLNFVKKDLSHLPDGTIISIRNIENKETYDFNYSLALRNVQLTDFQNHAFEIGSITKIFTAHILSQLVLENKINLDDPIEVFLPLKGLKDKKINFLHLVTHSSGLPRLPPNFYTVKNYQEENPYASYVESSLLEYLDSDIQLESLPGSQVAYSNFAYGLLSYLIEKIEQQSFENVIQQRICQPLNLVNTTFDIESLKVPLVQGLDKTGLPVPPWESGILAGSCGLFSTMEDMTKLAIYFLHSNDEAVKAQSKEQVYYQENRAIGLGWVIIKDNHPNKTFHRISGGTNGYTSILILNLEEQNGWIVLSNISGMQEEAIIEQFGMKLIFGFS